MKFFYYIISVLLLTLFSNDVKAASGIPFDIVNGLLLVKAEMNGDESLFIFDTGANEILIDASMTKTSVENDVEDHAQTIFGEITTKAYSIKHLKITDEINLVDHDAYVTNLNSVKEYTSLNIVGILGGNVFDGIIRIDFENSLIYIGKKIDSSTPDLNIPVNVINGIPFINITIDHQQFNFIFDSGASNHIINKSIIPLIKDVEIIEKTINIATAGNNHEIEKIAYTNFNVVNNINEYDRFLVQDLSKLTSEFGLQVDGVLSISQMQLAELILDAKENKMYIH